MYEKPNEYECEHVAFICDADGPKFMVRVKGFERHWYLKLSRDQARLIAVDATRYACGDTKE